MTTSIWSEVKFDFGVINSLVAEDEFNLGFCIQDNQYSVVLNAAVKSCCEEPGAFFFVQETDSPTRKEITIQEFNSLADKQEYTSIEAFPDCEDPMEDVKDVNYACFCCSFQFSNSVHTLVACFYNDHNGYYPCELVLERNGKETFMTPL